MKKIILAVACVVGLISCNQPQQPTQNSERKTAYVDTSKLLKEYQEAKDLEAKYKSKEEQLSKEMNAEYEKFRADVAYFEKNAQAKGMQWAQQTGAALQEREQRLMYIERGRQQKLSEEYVKEADTLVKVIKLFIKDYGKERDYDYVYGTNESSNTILYAKDGQDITDQVIKLLNDKYKAKQNQEDDVIIEEEVKDTTSLK